MDLDVAKASCSPTARVCSSSERGRRTVQSTITTAKARIFMSLMTALCLHHRELNYKSSRGLNAADRLDMCKAKHLSAVSKMENSSSVSGVRPAG